MLQLGKIQFLKQKNMLRVLYALAPIAVASIYFFGWRTLAVIFISNLAAFVTEWIMAGKRNGKISYACFVTANLYSLSLPPTVPLWIAATGAIIAILFGKEAFGGFGKNIFNPAVVGRGFVYVCFPVDLTSQFVPAFKGFPGGFAHWSLSTLKSALPAADISGLSISDAVTAATPMWSNRDFSFITNTLHLFFGNIGEVFSFEGRKMVLAAGSMGEVSALIIILAGIYLLWTKTANWRLSVSTLIGGAVSTIIFRNIFGFTAVPPLLFSLLSGGFLYATVFMVTDPVSAPKQKLSQWIYGIFIGTMIVFFRFKSIFAGGVAFSILLGNMLGPTLDLWVKHFQSAKKGAKSK